MIKDWKDIYKLPLRLDDSIGWVWDSNDNFVFQFTIEHTKLCKKIIGLLNGEAYTQKGSTPFVYEDGYIIDGEKNNLILIRGWGNLTGTGSHNLSVKEAILVQDTFGNYIKDKLNGNK
jgi:hypothetical protein